MHRVTWDIKTPNRRIMVRLPTPPVEMADKGCPTWSTCTSGRRRSMRLTLVVAQVALVCLVVYDYRSQCRSTEPITPLTGRPQSKSNVLQEALLPKIPRDPERLFYNRVPKCGSHTFLDVIYEMSTKHNFTFSRAEEYMRFYLEDYWQKKFVDRLRQIDPPMLYERHLHFLDFPRYGLEQPVYINLVRDPLDRLVSWYYFRRFQAGHERQMDDTKRNRTFDECVRGKHAECVSMQGDNAEEGYFKMIPFFCGQQDFCRKNQSMALQMAIRNVERNYVVVGVTEQFGDFIGALEHLLPTYFKGANHFYQLSEKELRNKHRTLRKVAPADDVSRVMKQLLENEYKFYKYVRQKFNKILYGLRLRSDSARKLKVAHRNL